MWPAPSLKALREQLDEAYRDNRLVQCLELEAKIHRAERRDVLGFSLFVTAVWVVAVSFVFFVAIRILQ